MKNLGLGIDAGGTYTDLVLLDYASRKIVFSTKEQTIQSKPIEAISRGLAKVDSSLLKQVRVTSLATTFATNAIVENKGGRAGLILVGFEEEARKRFKEIPVLSITGGHTVSGTEKAPLDIEYLKSASGPFTKGLDALAVASFFSVRNPEHELKVARLIRDRFDLPVICSHSFSMKLDFIKRANTALWNARLIPLITNLVKATTTVLKEYRVEAPLMMVKGDGTLMSAITALERPVETILSGPAASIMGAKFISGFDNALVVDIGGTTTDMAVIKDGLVKLNDNGVRIGPWNTHVKAADVRTIGVGGDSLISRTENSSVSVGPTRVIPLCMMAEKDGRVIDLLERVYKQIKKNKTANVNPTSIYFTSGQDAVKKEELSACSEFLQRVESSEFIQLARADIVELNNGDYLSSLTPTDVRVAQGRLKIGNAEAARLALKIFACYLGVDKVRLTDAVINDMSRKICLAVVDLLYKDEEDRKPLSDLVRYKFAAGRDDREREAKLEVSIALNLPLIALGAPARQFIKEAFQLLTDRCYFFDAYDVSVAVGAVVGMVEKYSHAKVRYNEPGKYSLHTELGVWNFNTMDEAIKKGTLLLKETLQKRMAEENIADVVFDCQADVTRVPSVQGKIMDLEADLKVHALAKINSYFS